MQRRARAEPHLPDDATTRDGGATNWRPMAVLGVHVQFLWLACRVTRAESRHEGGDVALMTTVWMWIRQKGGGAFVAADGCMHVCWGVCLRMWSGGQWTCAWDVWRPGERADGGEVDACVVRCVGQRTDESV